MRKTMWGMAGLGGLLALVCALAADAQGPAQKNGLTFKERLAKESKVKEADVEKVLKAFGPVSRDMLKEGKEIDLPGVGTLRVVRVAEYKDLVKGVPGTIPARNYLEFVSTAELTTAANSTGAVPAKTVEPYEFRVNPNSEPGLKAMPRKVSRSRAGR